MGFLTLTFPKGFAPNVSSKQIDMKVAKFTLMFKRVYDYLEVQEYHYYGDSYGIPIYIIPDGKYSNVYFENLEEFLLSEEYE